MVALSTKMSDFCEKHEILSFGLNETNGDAVGQNEILKKCHKTANFAIFKHISSGCRDQEDPVFEGN